MKELFRNANANSPSARRDSVSYSDRFDKIVFNLSLLGVAEDMMSDLMGIGHNTFDNWKKKHPTFAHNLKAGKLHADVEMTHSLFNLGTGYSHPHTVVLTNRVTEFDPDTGKPTKSYTEPLLVEIVKHVPPSIRAIEFWLSSRHPELWGSKKIGEVNITNNELNIGKMDYTKLSTAELRMLNKLGGQVVAAEDKASNIEDIEIEEED